MMRPLLMLIAAFSLMTSVIVQAQDTAACALEPRLIAGQEGRILYPHTVNLRTLPMRAAGLIASLDAGTMFTILDEPTCADALWWWPVDIHGAAAGANVGWMAEGAISEGEAEYWLEPRGERVLIDLEDGTQRAYVRLADGTVEPEGCLAPPEDYVQTTLGYATLNQRTLFMLDHAQRLYGRGVIDFRSAITQGSYAGGVEQASFGTHDGGGAVDLSVRSTIDWSILTDEIEPMIYALRVAGFAAWLRDTGSLYPDSPIHIHAIAIGDAELSPAARRQIDSEEGYFYGLNGLPAEWGGPQPDAHGGPVICAWMRAAGFDDLRVTVDATPTQTPIALPTLRP
jgi:hypothetical protein